jgi:hypothetical protein
LFVENNFLLFAQARIVLAGTPDLSGRVFNHADPLPHECGVPPQCPVAPRFLSQRRKMRQFTTMQTETAAPN